MAEQPRRSARPREVTFTLRPRVWAELQQYLDETGRRGEHGVVGTVLNDWLMEKFAGRSVAMPPAASAQANDEDDFSFDRSKL